MIGECDLYHIHRLTRSDRQAAFVEEGRLRRHSWVRGTFEDELVMSVLREDGKQQT